MGKLKIKSMQAPLRSPAITGTCCYRLSGSSVTNKSILALFSFRLGPLQWPTINTAALSSRAYLHARKGAYRIISYKPIRLPYPFGESARCGRPSSALGKRPAWARCFAALAGIFPPANYRERIRKPTCRGDYAIVGG